MSKTSAFRTLSIVCLAVAIGGFLVGSGGPGLVLAAGAIIVAAIAFIVSLVLRPEASDPAARTPDATERLERVEDASRWVVTLAILDVGLGAVALMVAFVVAKGEARGHAVGHLVLGAALLGLFAAIGSAWHPRAGSSSSNYRAALLIALWIASVATFLESIGAAGYGKFNAGHRLEWLTALHGMATPIAGLGILLLPLSVGALAIALVGRLVTRRRGAQRSRL
jgi:Na+-transporting methylmalonyl-CoA/oxaloacetate decarboxylase gamma subunit